MANGDHCKHVFSFTMIRGCTSSKCIDKISRADVSACHRISYGEPHADLGGVPTASNWPTTHNHATTQLWYELIRSTLRDGAFKFALGLGLSGQSVCAAMWRAAYDKPLSTFEAMCRAASKNEPVWAPDVLTNTALSEAAGSVKDSATTMSISVAWWAERLLWYNFMPHTTGQHGRIVADVTEWIDVYNNDFVPELSAAGMTSSRPAWYKARNRALQDLADTTYGPGGLPFQLVVRRKNSTFKKCDTCARLKLMHKEVLRGREVAEIEKAQQCMRAHSTWWTAQRVKLDQYRLAGGREDTIFEQADGCGEDCLNIPAFPRACSSNASGKWKLKQKLHATLYAGKQFTLLFTSPTVASGANFGVMAVLNGLANMFDSGLIPATKRTFMRGTDGGSENRCKVGHGMNAMLVQVSVVDCLLWARLPPNHSHDAVDRMFSAVEKWLSSSATDYTGCFTPWDMKQYLEAKFKSTNSAYKDVAVSIDTMVACFDFEGWLQDHIVRREFTIPNERRSDGTMYRPEPLVFRYLWSEELAHVVVQYKMDLSYVVATFEQDEWGPWEEAWVNDCDGKATRVLRSVPGGFYLIKSIPDLQTSPGYAKINRDDQWNRRRVFDDCRKFKLPPADAERANKVMDTLGDFFAQNQDANEMIHRPVSWPSVPHMTGLRLAETARNWHKLLLQHLPRAPLHGPPRASHAALSITSHSQPPPQPFGAAASGSVKRSQPPPQPSGALAAYPGPRRDYLQVPAMRASEANVVRHIGYTPADHARQVFSEQGEDYIEQNLTVDGALFWVELEVADGKYKVGLPQILHSNEDDEADDRYVEWFERAAGTAKKPTSPRFEWGSSVQSFRFLMRSVDAGTTGQQKRKTKQITRWVSKEALASFLPVVVLLCKNCGEKTPKVRKRGLELLFRFVRQKRPHLQELQDDSDLEDGGLGPEAAASVRAQLRKEAMEDVEEEQYDEEKKEEEEEEEEEELDESEGEGAELSRSEENEDGDCGGGSESESPVANRAGCSAQAAHPQARSSRLDARVLARERQQQVARTQQQEKEQEVVERRQQPSEQQREPGLLQLNTGVSAAVVTTSQAVRHGSGAGRQSRDQSRDQQPGVAEGTGGKRRRAAGRPPQ